MINVRIFFVVTFTLFSFLHVTAQEETPDDALKYHAEAFGSVSSGDQTPFWMVSNRYGTVPLDAGNGYLRGGLTNKQQLGNGFYWGAGFDAVISAPRYKNVYIQQLYAELGYKSLLLTVGSKEQYRSLLDRRLSSGDFIQSANARPIPEISIAVPSFLPIPYTNGWLQLKGHFGVGKTLDNGYLEQAFAPGSFYIKDVLYHQKAFHLRIKDSKRKFPFFATLGFQHIALWGGTSTNPMYGKQPSSLKDFLRIVFVLSGGDDAAEGEQINKLGNHHVNYDIQLGYEHKHLTLTAYHQRIAADNSGLLFQNRMDGLWGIQADINHFPWIKKVVAEFFSSRDQSGPFHYIEFDHDAHPGRGGGDDDYYNHYIYHAGNSYFNRAIGTPLIISPEYNSNRNPGFSSTRVQDYHFGLEGELSPSFDYRVLLTFMTGWGNHDTPFLKKKTNTSFLLDIAYTHPMLSGWQFTGSIAADNGSLLGDDSFGVSLGVRKTGILKRW